MEISTFSRQENPLNAIQINIYETRTTLSFVSAFVCDVSEDISSTSKFICKTADSYRLCDIRTCENKTKIGWKIRKKIGHKFIDARKVLMIIAVNFFPRFPSPPRLFVGL